MLYYFWPTIQFLSMANTFSCLNIHCVFSTKERVWVLNPDIRERLWPYMGGIAKQNGMIPKCIGGVSDHVHLLVTLPTQIGRCDGRSVDKGRIIGLDSSDLSKPPKLCLATGLWRIQRWYLAGTVHYIEQQLEHHRTRTFQEEYLAFLKKHGAHFDEKYLWD